MRPRILIAEDDAIVALGIQKLVESMGYEAAGIAATGEEAIRLAEALRPDVALMDIRLRGEMSGMEAAEKVQSRCGTPVIYVSAYSDEALIEQATRTAPFGYLTKPIRDRELHASIQTALYKSRTERALSRLHQLFMRSAQLSEPSMFDEVLELAVELTDSSMGFLHRVSADQKSVILTTWSKGALEGCSAAEETHYPIERAGNWVDCVRLRRPVVYNDFAASPNQKGLPPGHVPVRRFMSVPVLEADEVRIIFGVGNKAEAYDDADVVHVQRIANELQKILKQRKAAERVDVLSRLYRTISEINQVIVREKDRDRLFSEVCRIGVEHGGFAIVWAGLLDESGGAIRPAAAWGIEAGYVDELDVRLDAPAAELRPAARAVREDRVVVVDDTETDAGYEQWRAAARQRRFRSCAAFPVRAAGVVRGVLKVYATEPGVFHGEVEALLVELAGDLGFALGALDENDKRRQAERELRQANELLRVVIDAAPTAIIGLDLDGRVQMVWNRAAESLLGWTAREVMGRPLPGVPAQSEAEFGRFRRAIRQGLPLEGVEVRRQRKDGTPADFSVHAAPLRDPRGHVVGTIAVLVDIKDRKRAEEERLAHVRLLEALERVNRVIQGTHDPEQMPGEVLGTLCEILACDRAWLAYPCDPGAGSLSVVVEHAGPRCPAGQPPCDQPAEADCVAFARLLCESDGPVSFGGVSARGLAPDALRRPGCLSSIAMALFPKGSRPWVFGLDQHSHARSWTPEEETLVREVGRRLGDGLTNLLTWRELQQGESRYRRITEGLTDYLYSVRLESGGAVETALSPACTAVTGYTPEEFASDPELWLRVVAPEDRELVRGRRERILSGLEAPPLEHRIVRKDGALRWVSETTIVHKDATGRLLAYDGVVKDITASKRLELELRRLAAAIEQAAETILITDADATIQYVNPAFCRVTGYTHDEAIGANPRILRSGRQDDEFYRKMWSRLRRGETWHGHFVNQRKDGTLFEEEATISPVRDEAGAIAHYVAVKRDVTQEVALEARLRQSQQAVQQAEQMAAIGGLTAGVAHEVRNPLFAISANVDALGAVLRDRADVAELLDAVRAEVKRVNKLMVGLLQYGRPTIGEPVVEPAGTVVALALECCAALARERGVRLLRAGASPDRLLKVDRERLAGALENLIDNAIRFSERDSEVTVTVSEIAVEDSPWIRVVVRDRGPGFREEDLPHLFDLFFTRRKGGTGLGLPIAKKIVEQHGGRLRAERAEGGGAAMTVELPCLARDGGSESRP